MGISTIGGAVNGGGIAFGITNGSGLSRASLSIPSGYYQITFVPSVESGGSQAKLDFTTSAGTVSRTTVDLDSSSTGSLGMAYVNLPNGATQVVAYGNGSYAIQRISNPLVQQSGTLTIYRSSTSVTLSGTADVAIIGGGGGGGGQYGGYGGGSGHAKQFSATAGTYTITIGAGGGAGAAGGNTSFGATTVQGGNKNNAGVFNAGFGGSAGGGNSGGGGANGQIAQYGEPWPALFSPVAAGGTNEWGGGGGGGYGKGGNGGPNNMTPAQAGVDGGGGGGGGNAGGGASGGAGVALVLEWV